MKKLIVLVFLIFVVGCGVSLTAVNPERQFVNLNKEPDYKINEVQKKTVGEPMLIIEKILGSSLTITYPAFRATASYAPPAGFMITYPDIKQNSLFVCKLKTENGDFFCDTTPKLYAKQTGGGGFPYCVIIKTTGEAIGDGRCFGFGFSRTWAESQAIFKYEPKQEQSTDIKKDSYKKELIYNGKSKDSIKILYREFLDDMARPAFYQELSYDLSESKTIGFRGMQIEVLEATNSYIVFKVKTEMK